MKKRILSLALALVIMVGIAPTASADAGYRSLSQYAVSHYYEAMAYYDLAMTDPEWPIVPENVFLDPREAWNSYITNQRENNWFSSWSKQHWAASDTTFTVEQRPDNWHTESPEWWARIDSYMEIVATEEHVVNTDITWDNAWQYYVLSSLDPLSTEDLAWAEWHDITIDYADRPELSDYKGISFEDWTEMRSNMSDEENTLFNEWWYEGGDMYEGTSGRWSGVYHDENRISFEEYKERKGNTENQPTQPSNGHDKSILYYLHSVPEWFTPDGTVPEGFTPDGFAMFLYNGQAGPVRVSFTEAYEKAGGRPYDVSDEYVIEIGNWINTLTPEEYIKIRDSAENIDSPGEDGSQIGTLTPSASPLAIPCQYDDVGDFHEGLAPVRQDGKYGYIDKTGKTVIPFQYDDAASFSEGLAAVRQDDKWGFIDKTGKEVIPCQYFHAGDFSDGLARVAVGDYNASKYGFIDKAGKEVVPCQYNNAHSFSEGLAAVYMGEWGTGKWGFIDTTGKLAIPCKFDGADDFSDGHAVATSEATGGVVIDKTGQVVFSLRVMDWLPTISEGLVATFESSEDGPAKWGFLDQTGQTAIPIQYNYPAGTGGPWFSEGLAAVPVTTAKDELGYSTYIWGYIDKAGKEVVPHRYEMAEEFSEGFAAVAVTVDRDTYGNSIFGYGYIDKTGKEVVPCQYTNAHDVSEGMAAVCQDGKWGFLCMDGSASAATAYSSTQAVNVDGKAVEFQCYALKDAAGNMTNYIKLRDLADILNGSAAQFQVGWDGAVTITTKVAYTPNGSEGNTPFSGDRAYQEATAATKVNGKAAQLAAFVLNDDAGGGYTYYKLRDLGQALGFNVGWSGDKGVFIETNKPYDSSN